MLEGMAADDSAEREDRTVRFLESLCQSVHCQGSDQIRGPHVARRIQQREQQDCGERSELNQRVCSKVTLAVSPSELATSF